MSKTHFVILFTLAAAVSSAVPQGLPDRVSDDVRNVVQRAEKATEENDYQLALALYKGALYANGITFAIDLSSVDYFDQQDAIMSAMKIWSDELDGDFPLELIDDPKKADVVLKFVDSIDTHGADALGLIQLRKNYRWNDAVHQISYKGTIKIVRSAPGGELSQAETLDVVMHEFGHLLGLGDVPNAGVLMGPLKRGEPLFRPTAHETSDVLKLRSMLRQRIQQVQAMAKVAQAS